MSVFGFFIIGVNGNMLLKRISSIIWGVGKVTSSLKKEPVRAVIDYKFHALEQNYRGS